MDGLISVSFQTEFEYEENGAGILIPVRLSHGDRGVELRARLDTGASDCIFHRVYMDIHGAPRQEVHGETDPLPIASSRGQVASRRAIGRRRDEWNHPHTRAQ